MGPTAHIGFQQGRALVIDDYGRHAPLSLEQCHFECVGCVWMANQGPWSPGIEDGDEGTGKRETSGEELRISRDARPS
jgi:hypothetical protein